MLQSDVGTISRIKQITIATVKEAVKVVEAASMTASALLCSILFRSDTPTLANHQYVGWTSRCLFDTQSRRLFALWKMVSRDARIYVEVFSVPPIC